MKRRIKKANRQDTILNVGNGLIKEMQLTDFYNHEQNASFVFCAGRQLLPCFSHAFRPREILVFCLAPHGLIPAKE